MARWSAILLSGMAFVSTTIRVSGQDRLPLVQDIGGETPLAGMVRQPDSEMAGHYAGLRQFAHGKMLEGKSRWQEALNAYELALRYEPQSVELMRICIPMCVKMERRLPALKYYRQALSLQPQQPSLWIRYLHELLELERYEAVVATARDALERVSWNEHPALRAECLVAQAMALEMLGQYGASARHYEAAIGLVADRDRFLEDMHSPTAQELTVQHARLVERYARTCQRAGRFDAAVTAFREADAIFQGEAGRLDLNLAEVYLAAKQPEKAIIHLERVLASKPDNAEPYRLLAAALRQANRGGEVSAKLNSQLQEQPRHLALRLVLAEQLVADQRFAEAESLFRQLMQVEPVAVKSDCSGLLDLLARQARWKDMVHELDLNYRQPQRASWTRAMIEHLLKNDELLQGLLQQAATDDVYASTRLLLVKLALQRGLWEWAERLASRHNPSESRSMESYLLWCRALAEQGKYAEVAEVCRLAINDPTSTQILVFQLERAKALARIRYETGANQALQAARRLSAPGTVEARKTQCVELLITHLLGQHERCLKGAEAMITDLQQSPWLRQVRYLAASAAEALGRHDVAYTHLKAILSKDPNDAEAAAAIARVLILSQGDLLEAQGWIRDALELDDLERRQRRRLEGDTRQPEVNAAYQATLAILLCRQGLANDANLALTRVNWQKCRDAWAFCCQGDVFHQLGQVDAARQAWQRALELAQGEVGCGVDLRPLLLNRLHHSAAVLKNGSSPPVSSFSSPRGP